MSRKLFSQPYIFFETSIKDQVEGKVFEESKQEVDLQVVLIDQDFWRHPEEVDLIIKPLKQNLLLGSAASRCSPLNTIFTKLSIRTFTGRPERRGSIILPPFYQLSKNLPEIVDFFKKLKEFRPEPSLDDESYPVSVNQLIDEIKSENDDWKEGQKIELFVFARNSFIEKDYLSKSSFVLSLVQVRFDPGNIFDDGDIFGSKAEKNKKRTDPIQISEISIPMLEHEVGLFLKERCHYFRSLLVHQMKVEIHLPSNVFTKAPIAVVCDATPRLLGLMFAPSLDLFNVNADESAAPNFGKTVELTTVAILRQRGISQLYLFGERNFILSSIAEPSNSKIFISLWWYLTKNESALLVKADQRVVEGSTIDAHFAIFPTKSRELLIKGIASSDVMIFPSKTCSSFEKKSLIESQSVEACLDKIKLLPCYNPFLFVGWSSELLESQKSTSNTRSQSSSSSKKMKYKPVLE